jgi:DNA-binding GntR family transcriptional regulator
LRYKILAFILMYDILFVKSMARRSDPRPELPSFNSPLSVTSSVTKQVFESLKESILTQVLLGGTALIESQLAEEFGISKTPVREALQKLAQAGLVDMVHARGASVHTLSEREARDIFELRVLLEPQALLEGAKFFQASDLTDIERILRDAARAIKRKDTTTLSRLNIEFHRSLYSKSQNQILVAWLESLNDRRRLLSLRGWARDDRSLEELHEHQGVLEALKAGNPKLASTRLRDHIKKFSKLLLDKE